MAHDEWVRIATVRNVQAPKRELHIAPDPTHGHALDLDAEWLWLRQSPQARVMKHRVVAWKGMDESPIAVLGPGTTQDMCATLKGAEVVLSQEEMPDDSDGSWQGADAWIGFTVKTADGETLGTVEQCFATALNAALRVKDGYAKLFGFPVIPETVLAVDLDKGEITVGNLAPYRVDDED